jgi:hypothetical protein
MGSTKDTFDFALKERYTNKQVVENLVFGERPGLGKFQKDTELQGRGHPIPVIIRAPQGMAVNLPQAQINATTNSGVAGNVFGLQFMVTAGNWSAAVDIGEYVIRASKGNPGAFLQNKQAEIDGLYEGCADQMEGALFGDGTNTLGVSNAAVTTTTVTLTNPSDTYMFEKDMPLEASLASGAVITDALLAGSTYVSAVNRNAGTITLAALPAAWNAAGVLYLFRAGTFMGTLQNFMMSGVTAYLDATGTPPAIYGVTAAQRLQDPQRLAGVYIPDAEVAGQGIETRISMLGARATGRAKGKGLTTYFLHSEDWQNLEISLRSRGQRPLKDESTSFGYRYIEVTAGGVSGEVYPSRAVPKGKCLGLRLQNWTLMSMGELIGTLTGDGLQMLRKSNSNDYEYRLVSFPGLACNAPGWNGQVNVS